MTPDQLSLPDKDILQIFEELPDYYLILSNDLTIITASNAYVWLTGKSRQEMAGKNLFDIFPRHPDWAKNADGGIHFSLQKVLETNLPHELEVIRFDVPGADGQLQERYWKTSNKPVLNASGEIKYIIHKTADVTESVLAEKHLRDSLETERKAAAHAEKVTRQMELLFNEIPAQIAIVTGQDMVYEYLNPQYKRELFPNRDILGLPLAVALPEVIGTPIYKILYEVFNTGKTHIDNEIYIPLADAPNAPLRDHYFNLVYQPMKNERGEITGVISFKYEVTELVIARKKLEENERELFALNQELARANEDIMASNEELASSNEELKTTNEELQEAHLSLIEMTEALEERVKERTIELLWAQKDSETQRDRLRRLFMQAPAGICIMNGPDFIYELINPPYQKLIPGRNVLGKPIFEALPELRDQPIAAILQKVYETGQTYEGHEQNVPLTNPDGVLEDRYFNFIYQARHNKEGLIDGIMVFAFDVTESVNNRKKELENENRFRFLLNAIPQQVWTAGPDGTLDYVNEIVSRDFGDPSEQIVGSGWQDYIHPDDLSGCLKQWRAALKNGAEYMTEFRLKFADGNYRWHLARAVPLIEDGQIKLWLGTNTNIEVQKNNEQQKDEFLSIASHELRTPLTSIKAFNQLMDRINDPEKVKGFIHKSTGHIRRLEKLINDLLDVTRINAGKMIYDMHPFSFDQMLQESVENIQMTAPDHTIVLQENAPLTYVGDKMRLEQVINNFLSNAVKYSPYGKRVIVNSKVEYGNLVVSVQDFGIGIEQQHLNRLFERYFRIDNTAMRFEGLGLGLFISADILTRHKGSFWIESSPGLGSTFYFRLPLSDENNISVNLDEEFIYEDDSVRIEYNSRHHRIEAHWRGFQNQETIQRGWLKMLDMVKRSNATLILNDNTYVQGSWSEAAEWVGQEFFPMLEAAGVNHIAWIYSPSTFSQMAAQKSVDVATCHVVTQFFMDRESAIIWLDRMQ